MESIVLLLFCSGFILGIGTLVKESNQISKVTYFETKKDKKIYAH